MTMVRGRYVAAYFLLLLLLFSCFPDTSMGATAPSERNGIMTGRLQAMPLPFIATTGQMDAGGLFAARTFAGTVFVSRSGEIVYSFPLKSEKTSQGNGFLPVQDRLEKKANHSGKRLGLKEVLLGGAAGEIRGRDRIDTSYHEIRGNDPAHSQSAIPAYKAVDLGEVYDRIGLTLRAYGANVEKVFNAASHSHSPGVGRYETRFVIHQPTGRGVRRQQTRSGRGRIYPAAGGETAIMWELGRTSFSCHSGDKQASMKCLKILDTGLRRHDKVAGIRSDSKISIWQASR